MSEKLNSLKPEKVWKHFFALCNIPRISKHEEAVAAYIVNFAKANNIECHVDKIGNVLLRKPATKGMEGRKGIVMQGHIDMVAQKNSDKKFDFLKDSIKPIIETQGWLTADGTTLGADNGIGVSAALAVMESNDLTHGDIEALFTIDEETGMTGAFALKGNFLKSEILLNLDSEDEGDLYVGCAGGVDAICSFPINWQKVESNCTALSLNLSGMKGGHSGMDIILQRGNSNKSLARIINQCAQVSDIRVVSFNGGDVRNAIPRESKAIVVVKSSDVADFEKRAKEEVATIIAELKDRESGIELKIDNVAIVDKSFDKITTSKFINLIMVHPNGVMRMSDSISGLVETSINLGVIKTEAESVKFISLIRSSSNSSKDHLSEQIKSLFDLVDGKCEMVGDYNGWTPNMKSSILKVMQEQYESLYGVKPEIKAIHAGLECGIIGGIYPKMDMISIGPTIRSPHSPDEKVNIESVGKFYNFLIDTLAHAPKK